jgi:hypothetical protein
MDAHSHNLLESYISDSGNAYYYNALTTDTSSGAYYKVNFTRDVTPSGVSIVVTDIKNINNITPPTPTDTAFLTNEVNNFMGKPLNGNECQAIGWTYLGNMAKNGTYINNVISSAKTAGYTFTSIFYQAGYFVWGCADTKQFYDVQT